MMIDIEKAEAQGATVEFDTTYGYSISGEFHRVFDAEYVIACSGQDDARDNGDWFIDPSQVEAVVYGEA